ncbi:hypothetical protein DFH27DRAFT_570881 [Peziza echinospora]|nr:hypothetical protein DFH27DRAFT_570881 [Peziza echinospora]
MITMSLFFFIFLFSIKVLTYLLLFDSFHPSFLCHFFFLMLLRIPLVPDHDHDALPCLSFLSPSKLCVCVCVCVCVCAVIN